MAHFARDFLLPAPSAALTSCLRTELTYDVAYNLQGHLKLLLTDSHGHHPHKCHAALLDSGRNFLPSTTAALNFVKADRDFLGGWSAKGSNIPRACVAVQDPEHATGRGARSPHVRSRLPFGGSRDIDSTS